MKNTSEQIEEVLNFWFEELSPQDWYKKNDSLDQKLQDRFGKLLEAASKCELFEWRQTAQGCLAEIIVLDQFSRNIFRDKPRAFAQDSLALALAQECVAKGMDAELPPVQKAFVYMPYMHSESALVHEVAVELFKQEGLEKNLKFEYAHKKIIGRFGRYPHRNSILGRKSTAEELAFLSEPGSSF